MIRHFLQKLDKVDRRIVYIFVVICLAIPLKKEWKMRPADMASATKFFDVVDRLDPENGQIAIVSADWGAGSVAESRPQTAVAIEHLMRRRVPFAIMTVYALGSPFIDKLPREIASELERENPGEHWSYGKDWVNIGYFPNGGLTIQGWSKSENLIEQIKTDAYGTPISEIPCMSKIRTKKDISLVLQFTSLVGTLSNWIQFFSGVPLVHGCTSISVPEAHNYLAAKQIIGLHEGIAGAAWYETLLSEKYPQRKLDSKAIKINTSLSYAHILIIFFVVIGNIAMLLRRPN